MKNLLTLFLLSITFSIANAQDLPATSGTFLLHKFQQNIGKETYSVDNNKDSKKYTVNFKFVDRGTAVPLKAELKVNLNFEPLELMLKGSTSRFSKVDDAIKITGNTAVIRVNDSTYTQQMAPFSFTIAGYSPATVQMVLLQYWNKHHQPLSINALPFGTLQVSKEGTDKLLFNDKPLTLIRYTIHGLVWGSELVWTDERGQLICILTNDAEGDKTEMMNEPYESLLPELIKRAAGYIMESFAAASPAAKSIKSIAITGGTIADVNTGAAIPNGALLLQDGIIKKIGKAGDIAIPAGTQIIDATGKTILPGLWDMHSHFEQAEWGPAYLAAGVTTVRDCGNELGYINELQKAIDGGKGIGPKILMAGIIDGKGPMSLGIIQADNKEEAIKAVDTYKARGFDQIKVYSSVKPAVLKMICDEAHKQGLTVTGHIPNYMTLQRGIDSGMNMVNHIQYVYGMMRLNKDRSVNFDDSISIAAIRFIKKHKVVIDPTLGVYELAYRNVKDDIIQMEPGFYNLPLPLQTLFKNTGEDPETAAKLKPMLTSMGALVKKLYDAGIPVIAGTDMGFPGYSLPPGAGVVRKRGTYPRGGVKDGHHHPRAGYESR